MIVEGKIGASKGKNVEYGDFGIKVGEKWFNTLDEALWQNAHEQDP